MKVVVLGQGFVGLPRAMDAAAAGHEVVGFELDKSRLAHLSAGHSYVEDVSSVTLKTHMADGTYYATSYPPALRGFDVAVITTPIPIKERILNPEYIRDAAARAGIALREGGLVVLESTAPPGTTRNVVTPALEEMSLLASGTDFHVAFSSERITAEPSARIIGGYTMACRQLAAFFYKSMPGDTTLAKELEKAELASMAGARP